MKCTGTQHDNKLYAVPDFIHSSDLRLANNVLKS